MVVTCEARTVPRGVINIARIVRATHNLHGTSCESSYSHHSHHAGESSRAEAHCACRCILFFRSGKSIIKYRIPWPINQSTVYYIACTGYTGDVFNVWLAFITYGVLPVDCGPARIFGGLRGDHSEAATRMEAAIAETARRPPRWAPGCPWTAPSTTTCCTRASRRASSPSSSLVGVGVFRFYYGFFVFFFVDGAKLF